MRKTGGAPACAQGLNIKNAQRRRILRWGLIVDAPGTRRNVADKRLRGKQATEYFDFRLGLSIGLFQLMKKIGGCSLRNVCGG